MALVPQFGDKETNYRVSGVTNSHSDGVKGGFADYWLTTAKLGMSWQGRQAPSVFITVLNRVMSENLLIQ